MRVAAVYLSHFVCACEVKRHPELARLRVIIGDAEPPRRVLDCSPEVEYLGVFAGMQIRPALSLAPNAVYLPPDHPYYTDTWSQALDSLWNVSPEVEDAGLGEAYVNVAGLLPHYGSEAAIAEALLTLMRRAGFVANVGIGEGKFPARAAARTSDQGQVHIIAGGNEAEFLAPLGVGLLPFSPELIERLRLLGLDEIGGVARLPLPALVSQFGRDGSRLWHLARGEDRTRLVPRQPSVMVEDWVSFEGPVVRVEVLVAGLRQLVSRLTAQLNGRSGRELGLRAVLSSGRIWEKKVTLKDPVSHGERLLFIAKTNLTEFPPPGPVTSLGLRMNYLTGETGRQLSLGEKRSQDNLKEVIRQLKSHHRHSPIYQCVEVEPWSVIPEDRHLLVESDA